LLETVPPGAIPPQVAALLQEPEMTAVNAIRFVDRTINATTIAVFSKLVFMFKLF
jgi:hypothetical protein